MLAKENSCSVVCFYAQALRATGASAASLVWIDKTTGKKKQAKQRGFLSVFLSVFFTLRRGQPGLAPFG